MLCWLTLDPFHLSWLPRPRNWLTSLPTEQWEKQRDTHIAFDSFLHKSVVYLTMCEVSGTGG